MACGDSARRRCILDKLQNLVDSMDCCEPCPPPPPPCPPKPICCPPMIELYDPCPKPAIPLACPGPISPLDPDIPVPHVASPTNPCGGVCIPIVTPQPVPCIPLAGDCGGGMQPCVPCNPPQMMVCYRRSGGGRSRRGGGGGGGGGRRGGGGGGGCGMALQGCRSRELRAGILYTGCFCEKRNGLQDQCPRRGCQGGPMCLFDPPGCCPSQFADGKHLPIGEPRSAGIQMPGRGGCGGGGGYSGGGGSGGSYRAEYLCFPAYFKMPPCSSDGCPPPNPFGGPMPCTPLPCPNAGPCPTCDECCPIPQCCPPVPTIPMPPCPPVTVPAPPQVIPTPVPLPVPTAIYPMMPNNPPTCSISGPGCPPPCCPTMCGMPCGPMC